VHAKAKLGPVDVWLFGRQARRGTSELKALIWALARQGRGVVQSAFGARLFFLSDDRCALEAKKVFLRDALRHFQWDRGMRDRFDFA